MREFQLSRCMLQGKDYLLSQIAYGAALTIEGLKPSSLVSLHLRDEGWDTYKDEVCASLELDHFVLRKGKRNLQVLFFRNQVLSSHLACKENGDFLRLLGYTHPEDLEQSLRRLKDQFQEGCPHEIGVFLGIPLPDILGFMQHKGAHCLFCGYWKVYHNPERMKDLFSRFDEARAHVVNKLVSQGLCLET